MPWPYNGFLIYVLVCDELTRSRFRCYRKRLCGDEFRFDLTADYACVKVQRRYRTFPPSKISKKTTGQSNLT